MFGFMSSVSAQAASGSSRQVIGTILFFALLILCFLILWWLESRRKPKAASETKAQVVREEPAHPVKPDDLAIVEGIGPKIKQILAQHGISTFTQLAAANVDDLKKILTEAGLNMTDPTTWPEQARLVAVGDMQGLEKLKDSLKGGRIAT